MNLDTDIEREVMESYNDYWESYMNGNWQKAASYLDDSINMIGSAEVEVYHNKKQTTKYFKDSVEEVVGKMQMRNRIIDIDLFDLVALIIEQLDCYIKPDEEWVFYSKFRITSVMKKTIQGWKFVQQHGSVPDSKIQGDETLGFDKVTQENLELRDAIKRRTIELEQKNRELEVEAALERVRARTMAMHRSEELAEVSELLFHQVKRLGFNLFASGFTIWDEENNELVSWMCSPDGSMNPPFRMPIKGDAFHTRVYESWVKGEKIFIGDLVGEELQSHFRYLRTFPLMDQAFEKNIAAGHPMPERQVHQVVNFSHGNLLFITFEPVPGAFEIFKRFGKVFEQAYTRFLDLQKAEAQAREAIKQSSLDRVRGEIASMRSTEDLDRITPLVFNELTTLGVPFFRCGVFIIHENKNNVELYLSSPDGKALRVLNFSFTSNELTTNAVESWRKNKVYHQHWSKTDFINWTKALLEQGQVQNQEIYQGTEEPPESLDLHFIPFAQGMLYIGNIDELKEDEIDLVKSLAAAFAMAYARYEDFKQLEEAKLQTEITLAELKAAQSQLIQSEKMASLGELTAGIAHEIQNPLNFVNNFSEVSRELVDEMNKELDKDEIAEAKSIAGDIKQNLEKINHHGQRASSIVKGMLEHSRAGDGKKELTDINALCDEYLRLAYHGMRAKDKTFNADFKTEFDETLPKINIVPQDIGRVILNIINNAFYAVAVERLGRASLQQPTVTVSTKLSPSGRLRQGFNDGTRGTKGEDSVQIFVKDNGPGIPPDIKDKIFQPFFTTKPTGKGTGLGLSLSYDIIKAQGGELRVESEVGKGSEFAIILPFERMKE